MKILLPGSAASPRPLAPAVAVAALSVLVGGLLPQPPSATTEGAPDARPLDDAARAFGDKLYTRDLYGRD